MSIPGKKCFSCKTFFNLTNPFPNYNFCVFNFHPRFTHSDSEECINVLLLILHIVRKQDIRQIILETTANVIKNSHIKVTNKCMTSSNQNNIYEIYIPKYRHHYIHMTCQTNLQKVEIWQTHQIVHIFVFQ